MPNLQLEPIWWITKKKKQQIKNWKCDLHNYWKNTKLIYKKKKHHQKNMLQYSSKLQKRHFNNTVLKCWLKVFFLIRSKVVKTNRPNYNGQIKSRAIIPAFEVKQIVIHFDFSIYFQKIVYKCVYTLQSQSVAITDSSANFYKHEDRACIRNENKIWNLP